MQYVDINMHIYGRVSVDNLAKLMAIVEPPAAEPGTLAGEAATEPAAKRGRPAKPAEEKQPETPPADGDDNEISLREECGVLAKKYAGQNGVDAFKEVLAAFEVKNISAVPDDRLEELRDKLAG